MAGYKEKKTSLAEKIFPAKGDSKGEAIRKIVVLIAFAVLVVSLIILISYFAQHARTKADIEQQREQHTSVITITQVTTAPVTESETTETEPPPLVVLPSMESFLAENPDTAGWITIPGTNVDNVVVQAADNDYYLSRDFNGNKNAAGQIYVDFRCIINDYEENQSDNIVVYGHNQADGTMFGTLKKYKIKKESTKNFDFYLENPTFTFSNLYEEYTYKIIALFVIEVEPYQTRDGYIFDYHNFVNFGKTKRKFSDFKENVLARTAVNTGVDFDENDKYMTLSTCSNEFEPSRFVVIGRRVRDGESPEVNVSLAEINTDMLEPDYNYIYSR
ncbi:MAG: class B sortase [Oscillospiraceae bacterium]|nr:class B sortase [Oscillospiraceae bacterium]